MNFLNGIIYDNTHPRTAVITDFCSAYLCLLAQDQLSDPSLNTLTKTIANCETMEAKRGKCSQKLIMLWDFVTAIYQTYGTDLSHSSTLSYIILFSLLRISLHTRIFFCPRQVTSSRPQCIWSVNLIHINFQTINKNISNFFILCSRYIMSYYLQAIDISLSGWLNMVNMVQRETTSLNILLIKATNTVIGVTSIVVDTHKQIEPLQCHVSIQTSVYSFKLID